MKCYENPKSYYKKVKLGGQMLAIWPLETGASDIKILFHTLYWWFSFFNSLALITPLILAAYYFKNDSTVMTKVLTELTASTEFCINLIQCKIQNYNFQVVLEEMYSFIRKTNEHEELSIKKYINKYKSFQIFLGSSFVICATSFVFIPIVTSQPLPADGWYPFSIKSYPIRITLYILQVLAIGQVGTGFIVDIVIATLIWFCALKTELLENRICEAKGKADITHCAYQHRQLILLSNRVQKGVKYIILKTNITMAFTSICGAFQLINHVPFEQAFRFIPMVIAASLKLYVTAKPADDLKENSEKLARTAFLAALQQESPSDARLALMLAHRCQKPNIISVTAVIKVYCLEYYALFLSTLVKYFVNLRALLS